jgi:hypothetical protein
MRLFLHVIRAIFGVFLDSLTFIIVFGLPRLSPPKINFCANNSAFLSSVKSNPDELPIRSDSHSPDYPGGLIGGML